MPQPDVAQRPRTATAMGKRTPGRHYGPRNWPSLLTTWQIEDVARLRLFRAGRQPYARDLDAFAATLGLSNRQLRAVMDYLPEKPCCSSASVIDDGPLTHAERMALIWEAERKPRNGRLQPSLPVRRRTTGTRIP